MVSALLALVPSASCPVRKGDGIWGREGRKERRLLRRGGGRVCRSGAGAGQAGWRAQWEVPLGPPLTAEQGGGRGTKTAVSLHAAAVARVTG